MKKIFTLTAVSLMLAAGSTFAACPIKATPMQNSCTAGNPTGAAAPISYIVAPVQQRTYLPACNTCDGKTQKKGFFSKVFTPVRNIYDATLNPIFTGLYN